jgi:alkanesulfonate monooxygenase SsuD/methylene tetrahydromethanopterin reductase-like flavin-dependent oxidoreductase (luciferase family)
MPRFGVSIIPSASRRSDPVEQARRAEELGFDLVSIWDHPHGENPSFETWTLMTWIAARTTRILVASNVLGLPFRLPALTAKMAETLDLSAGRLIIGLGGGGDDEEFAGFGAPARTPSEKVEALEEGIAVIRGVWAESPFTYHGRHYRNEAAMLEPKPSHGIPIWLGTYGRRALELTGREADGWIPSMGPAPPSQVTSKMKLVRRAAEHAGRDPDSLEYAYNVSVRIGAPPDDDPERRVTGEPDEIVERMLELLDPGVHGPQLLGKRRREEQQERLASEVVTPLRQLG